MTTNWGVPLLAALLVTVLVTPVVRRLASRAGFVSNPVDSSGRTRTVPYGGGLVIVVACAVGTLVGPFGNSGRTLALLGAATLLALVGLVDDYRTLGAGVRFASELAVAVAAYAAGIRAVATGIEPLDFVITVLWIAGLTNAFNFMDNMDGLSATTAVATAAPLFAIAALGEQYRVATLAIALTGACLGFVAHNFRPAAIFMGDCGALFVGFLLATLSLQVDPALAPPASFLVPLMLLAVPIVDTTTVTIGRLRHGRSPLVGGKDHLSHRLVSKGASREQAILLLAAFQFVIAVIAALAGRGALPLPIATAAAAVVIAVLVAVAVPARMYRDRATGLPRRLRSAAGIAAFALVAAAIPAAIALLQARGPMQAAGADARAALAAARAGDTARAAQLFAAADAGFTRARRSLDAPWASGGLAVPVLSSNLRAGRTLAATGHDLSSTGAALATGANVERLRVAGGRVDLHELERLRRELTRAEGTLHDSVRAVESIRYPYLLPQVSAPVADLRADLARAWRDARDASAAADLLPLVLGGDGGGKERRYFVAVQNNAEARATGGFIGNYGELVASGGGLRLARFGRIGELNGDPGAEEARDLQAPPDYTERYSRFSVATHWQNVNLSPDLPTVSKVIADLYPKSGGSPIDGVVAIDPIGLAALLQLTGPIDVPPWPEPIRADNVVDVTLKRAYERFPAQEERVTFLGDVAHRIVAAATAADLGSPQALIRALGPAVRGGHLQVSLIDKQEQQVARRLGLHRAIGARAGDSLLVTTQNAAANKVDVYLARKLQYDIRIDPAGDASGKASVSGSLRADLRNDAPATGLPASVLGPYDDRFTAGENLSFVSVYSPFALRSAKLDGQPTGLEIGNELGRSVYSAYVSIASGQTRQVELDLGGTLTLAEGGWYDLELLNQPSLAADDVDVTIDVADGWRIVATRGLTRTSATRAVAHLEVQQLQRLRVKLAPATPASVFDRLLAPTGAALS